MNVLPFPYVLVAHILPPWCSTDLACYGKAETAALDPGNSLVFRPLERLENQLEILFRYAYAGIGDLGNDLRRGGLLSYCNMDRIPAQGEFDRIRKDVGHDLNETVTITGETGER